MEAGRGNERPPQKRPEQAPDAQDHQQPRQGSTSRPHSTQPEHVFLSVSEPGFLPPTEAPTSLSSERSLAASGASSSGPGRRLLPTPATDPEPSTLGHQPAIKRSFTGRVQVAAACLACRRRKVKCNGARPACARCQEQSLQCEYDSEPDSTRMLTLKRRQRELELELEDLRELFSYFRSRTEPEALEILRRIRSGPSHVGGSTGNSGVAVDIRAIVAVDIRAIVAVDIRAIVDVLRSGDLLLQSTGLAQGTHETQVRLVEQAAIAQPYAIRVPARPWITLVGDGLVSELIGSFFAWDATSLLPFVDRTCFVQDMMSADAARARLCSPLLVHAICTLESYTSPRAKTLSSIYCFNLSERLFRESKALLERERGRVTLPTAWALSIMHVCCAAQGQDRAGNMYRLGAYDMMDQMESQMRFEMSQRSETREVGEALERVYSRSLWGMYCFSSFSSFAYLLPSSIPRPTIRRRFYDSHAAPNPTMNKLPDDWPISAAVLDAGCDLSVIYNEVMEYNCDDMTADRIGSEADVQRRMAFFEELREWRDALPFDVRSEKRFSPATIFVGYYADQTFLAIFRLLAPDTLLPSPLSGTAGDVCISTCARSIDNIERLTGKLELKTQGYGIGLVYMLHHAAVTLVAVMAGDASSNRKKKNKNNDKGIDGTHQNQSKDGDGEGGDSGDSVVDGDSSKDGSEEEDDDSARSDVSMQDPQHQSQPQPRHPAQGGDSHGCAGNLLARACHLLAGPNRTAPSGGGGGSGGYPLEGLVLRGLRAWMGRLGVDVPDKVAECFAVPEGDAGGQQMPGGRAGAARDVPFCFVVPLPAGWEREDVFEGSGSDLEDEGFGSGPRPSVQLGRVISWWEARRARD